MKNIMKRIAAVSLAVVMVVTGIYCAPQKSDAAGKYKTIVEEKGTAEAGQEVTYNFSISKGMDTYYGIYTALPMSIEIGLYKGNVRVDSWEDDSYSNYWQNYGGVYAYAFAYKLSSAGDYQLKVKFGSATNYAVYIDIPKATPKISAKSVTITKGFAYKLSVKDAGGKVTWSSNKKSVASVDSKGKVTAKKKGTAVITAKTAGGAKLTCKVKVKDNIYSGMNITLSDVKYGHSGLAISKMSYDKKGNLLVKMKFVNNIGYKVVNIKNVNVALKDVKGKVIGKVKIKKKKMTVPYGGSKTFTVKIKKSALKVKKSDLRNATYKFTTKYIATYMPY